MAQTHLSESLDWDWTFALKPGSQLWAQCLVLASCFCLKAELLVKFPLEIKVETTKPVSCTLERDRVERGGADRNNAAALLQSAAAVLCHFLWVELQASVTLPLFGLHSFPLF